MIESARGSMGHFLHHPDPDKWKIISTEHFHLKILKGKYTTVFNRTCLYIYIYIVIHRQTVSFYQNSSVWLDTQDAQSQDRNLSNFTLDCDSDHSATKRTMLAKGIFKVFLFLETAVAAFVYIFL